MHLRHDSIACAPSAKFAASTMLGWHSRQLPIKLVISSDCTALQAAIFLGLEHELKGGLYAVSLLACIRGLCPLCD